MTTASHPADGRPGKAGAQLAEPPGQSAASPAAPRNLLRSPVLQGVLAFLIYLAAFLETPFRPILLHASQAVMDQKSMDPNFYVWGLRWWPYAIGHGLNPLYTHQIAAPGGHSLVWVTTAPPVVLLAVPLTLIAGPVAALNLLTALSLPVSAWAAFVLCRRLTGKFWPALAGGAVFGFSAYEVNHAAAGQLNLIYSLLLPILGYLIVVWRDGAIRTRTFVILAGLVMALQFYLMMEVFADLTAILVVALLVGFALAGRAARPEILRLARAIGLAYVIAVVLAVPDVAYALTVKPPRPAPLTEMDLASLVVPRPERTFGISWLAHAAAGPAHVSNACYVGIPLLLLVVLLAVTRWSSTMVRFLTCMLAIIIVAAIGPVLYLEGSRTWTVPWARVFHLPLVRNAYPLRLMLFAYLVLAVATAVYLAAPARRVPWTWARWSLAVLVVASVGLDTLPIKDTTYTSVPKFISKGDYRRQLSPGEIVVVVSEVGNAGMLWQAQSDFYMRIAGGYINAGLARRTDLPLSVQDLSSATPDRVAKFEQFVRTGHVGAILLDAGHEPKWVGIFWRMGLKGHRIGNVIVYKTDGCRSCRAVSWAQLGKRAPAAT
ncbi:MAG TPA: hypothetical protein VMA73_03705 [Streptosporangiaceae bacterium]|nr:hypothetical protein [Streptosporangiaceae bacterium]